MSIVKRKINFTIYFYTAYVVILFFVFVRYFPNVFETSYDGLLFPYDFNIVRYVISAIVSVVILFVIHRRYSNLTKASQLIILFLLLLYFIPGLLICSVTETSWIYMCAFILFLFMLLLFDNIIKYPQKRITIKNIESNRALRIFIAICFVVTLYLAVVFGQTFTINKFIAVMTDVYETRASALQVHWLITTLQLWAVYFSVFMITFFMRKGKILLVIVFIFFELFYFILQGNRIGLFVTALAVLFGLFRNVTPRIIALAFLSIAIIIWVECSLFELGGIITNVFRRFSIVPNRLGFNYFDFFQYNTPDFLRTTYSRIFNTLGIVSPYPNISHIIGEEYYRTEMGANTGMMGSAMYIFGNIGLVIEPLCIVIFTRIIDKCTISIRSTSILCTIAVVFASLLINAPAALANCFKMSYYMLLVITLLFVTDHQTKSMPIDRMR